MRPADSAAVAHPAAPSQPARLSDLAKTVRSKNAGVDKITFDVIFSERANFERVRDSGVLNREFVAKLYSVPQERITDFVVYEPALAIKFTMLRKRPSGSPGDADIFGAQQYAPLLDVLIPAPTPAATEPRGAASA